MNGMAMRSFETTVAMDMAGAEQAIREALGAQGFGVLTEIDVAATLNAKLGIDRPPLKILGACNPTLAHRALQIDPSVALLLPCNVVLEQHGDGTRVRVVDPLALMGDPRFGDLADEAAAKLQAAVDDVGARAR
jgi:uncharacterized protein (DUF302 family)